MSDATFSEDAEADLLDIAEFIARDNPTAFLAPGAFSFDGVLVPQP